MPAPARRAVAQPRPVPAAAAGQRPARRPGAATTARPARRPATPRREPVRRAELRVVDPAKVGAAQLRQRRARVLAFGGGAALMVSLLATAASHALLVSGQAHLDSLQGRVAAEQARYSRARLRVAELEAPEQIVREARKLGMVPPSKVTYLTPSSAVAAEVGAGDVSEPAPNPATAGGTWADVKPYLAAQAG